MTVLARWLGEDGWMRYLVEEDGVQRVAGRWGFGFVPAVLALQADNTLPLGKVVVSA